MPTCPNGHDSDDAEFCDVCGRAMDAAPVAATAGAGRAATGADRVASTPTAAPQAGTPCPACGVPLDGRFCEECGHDSLAAPPPRPVMVPEPVAPSAPSVPSTPIAPSTGPTGPTESTGSTPAAGPGTWAAKVNADRAYYNSVIAAGGPDAAGISFPAFCPERYFPLRGNQISIGRRSASRGIKPDIDLTGPPEDPGVSHLHAVLVARPDGSLSIVDVGSSNGTTVNDGQMSLPANVPHPLSDGDEVHLGAWTTITVTLER